MPCKVSEFVRESPLVYDENTTVAEAVRGMADRNLGSVIVTAANEVVGLFTERDLVKRVLAVDLDPSNTTLGKVCSRQLISIPADASCREAVLKMHANSFRRLLVYRGSHLVGLVKMQDLALGIAAKDNQRDWLPNAIVGLTVTLVITVIVLLIAELPDVLAVVRGGGVGQ